MNTKNETCRLCNYSFRPYFLREGKCNGCRSRHLIVTGIPSPESCVMRKIDRFNDWYRTSGHWVYSDREKALDQYMGMGLNGLDDLTVEEYDIVKRWRKAEQSA